MATAMPAATSPTIRRTLPEIIMTIQYGGVRASVVDEDEIGSPALPDRRRRHEPLLHPHRTRRRLPQHIQVQLLTRVAAVEKDDRGEPLFLEAHVDGWVADQYASLLGRRVGRDDFLTIRLPRCSYSEARNRMLDGRIKTIKDGRWLRTCREWVEQYVAAKTVKLPTPEVVELALFKCRQYVYVKLRKDGMGYEGLRSPA